MKGDITLKILETIGDAAITAADLAVVMLTSGYGASYGKLQYNLSRRQNARAVRKFEKKFQMEQKRKYNKLICKLKRSGLIQEETKSGTKMFKLSRGGKEKIKKLKEKAIQRERLPEFSYSKEKSARFIIVAFDIPETEKNKRIWLRSVLIAFGFKMLQKSLWIGKIKLPKKFVDDLIKLKLIGYVEIFEISKGGSLEQVA